MLAEAAAFQHRQPAVVHVLESAVVGWIRQIRNVLRHDALAASKYLQCLYIYIEFLNNVLNWSQFFVFKIKVIGNVPVSV